MYSIFNCGHITCDPQIHVCMYSGVHCIYTYLQQILSLFKLKKVIPTTCHVVRQLRLVSM